jgi:DNA recombination protein RmuC
MSSELQIVLIVFSGLFFGIIIGRYVLAATLKSKISLLEQQLTDQKSQQAELKNLYDRARSDTDQIRTLKEGLATQLSRKEADFDNLWDRFTNQKQEIEELRKRFATEFENLANRILEEKSTKFTEQNKQHLQNILSPLQDKINLFEKKVEDTHKESIGQHAALKQQIISLSELNAQMSRETLNLTRALKGENKTQGNWGELVLERVLEKSGLEKGREYFVQQSHINEDGKRLLPDVVIHLPEGRKMIIDSKVTLTSYERYINAEDDNIRALSFKEHVNSIKRHVEQLGQKNYHHLYQIQSPDFVLLFIPIEPAFAIAVNEDHSLYNRAFEKNIVIVTPATLLATLRTIDSMWTNQKQQENAMEIARQAGALYDKFEGLVNDLLIVGKKMDESRKAYDESMKKLHTGNGNLVNSIQKIRKLGARAKKSLPEAIVQQAMATENDIHERGQPLT